MSLAHRILRLAVLALTLVLVSCTSNSNREPRFEQATLTELLRRYEKAKAGSAEEQRSAEAIRAIGTNALPFLVEKLSIDDLILQTQGKNGFQILGLVAEPAIPGLTHLLYHTNEVISLYAAQSLGDIGPAAVPVLVEAFQKKRTRYEYVVGTHAAMGLWDLGTNAQPAIPILLEDLQHRAPPIRQRAADTLGYLAIDGDRVIPALTNLITRDLNAPVCFTAISALKRFGPSARNAAVPTLLPLLENEEFMLSASNALFEIAPDVLTNAPVK
jgi:HEAT repeat protein